MRKLTIAERRLMIFKRKEKKLTVEQLSEELHMSKSNLSRIENGKIMASDENRGIIEDRFSICFSIEDNLVEKFESFTKENLDRLIYYKLFGEYSRQEFDITGIQFEKSILYPPYMLLKLFIFSTKNIEEKFVNKYLPIFGGLINLFDQDFQKLYYISSINCLYFDKNYDKALILCEYVESNFVKDRLLDSYLYHIKSMIYICLGNQPLAMKTINYAISLSTSLANAPRLIALNILKANSLRLSGKCQEALLEDHKNFEYANKMNIHFYDYTIYSNTGWSYYLLNDYENAIKYYKKAENIDIDDDICFMTALCSYRLGLRSQCKEYLTKGRRARNVGLAFPYLIDWLELTLNKKYSVKAEKRLLYCLKKYENIMHFDSRNNIYKLLIEHYHYHQEYKKEAYYQEKLNISYRKLKEGY
ncbi:MAG: tetratricopeptide repeat protein [Beduini sp.]|uniref:tetratricopeptide repeat protein n=2 Tax=Beduini sp. TaxID=1922300 RepID=UPI0011C9FBED